MTQSANSWRTAVCRQSGATIVHGSGSLESPLPRFAVTEQSDCSTGAVGMAARAPWTIVREGEAAFGAMGVMATRTVRGN